MAATTFTLDTRTLSGPILDVYGDWQVALQQIGNTRPHGLKFQGWPNNVAPAVKDARKRWPDALISVCPGMDPIATRWRSHRDTERTIAEITGIADTAVALGVGHLVFDPEEAWKGQTTQERAKLDAIAAEAQRRIRAKHPALRLYATTYGWIYRARGLGGHTSWSSRGWLSGGTVYVSQVYDRGRGQLAAGEAAARESFAAMVAAKACDLGTARLVEIQTHGNSAAELASVGTSSEATFWWAAGKPELFDAEGALGWRTALALYRAGFWGEGCVARFQAAKGLTADGIAGPKTRAALGVQ